MQKTKQTAYKRTEAADCGSPKSAGEGDGHY